MSDYIQSILDVGKAYDREIMPVETKKLEAIQAELTRLRKENDDAQMFVDGTIEDELREMQQVIDDLNGQVAGHRAELARRNIMTDRCDAEYCTCGPELARLREEQRVLQEKYVAVHAERERLREAREEANHPRCDANDDHVDRSELTRLREAFDRYVRGHESHRPWCNGGYPDASCTCDLDDRTRNALKGEG